MNVGSLSYFISSGTPIGDKSPRELLTLTAVAFGYPKNSGNLEKTSQTTNTKLNFEGFSS